MGFSFFLTSSLLGLSLAVDAFLISLSNGLNGSAVGKRRIFICAAVFAAFEFIAPLTGWSIVYFTAKKYEYVGELLSVLACVILIYIGVTMIFSGIAKKEVSPEKKNTGLAALILQALLTSVDALSVGIALPHYSPAQICVCSLIIAAFTFSAYTLGYFAGGKYGMKFADKAEIIGGIIFVVIGIGIVV